VLPIVTAIVVRSDYAATEKVGRGLAAAADELAPLASLRAAMDDFSAAAPSARDAGAVLAAAESLPCVQVDAAALSRLDPLRAALADSDTRTMRVAAASLDRAAREACVARLLDIVDAEPRAALAWSAAIEQQAALALRATGSASVAIADDRAFEAARVLADRFVLEHPGSKSVALRADLALVALRGGLATDGAERARIEGALRAATDMQPSNPRRWRDLGAALLVLGRPADATDALRRALEVGAATTRHDPLAGLSERELREIESMLAAGGEPAAR
jgi:hypothetical protein